MKNIKMISFNLGLLKVQLGPMKIFEFSPFVEERFNSLQSELRRAEADILCLQEIYDPRQIAILSQDLQKVFPFCYRPQEKKGWAYPSGLLLFSKWPILEAGFVPFQRTVWDERLYVHKGFLWAQLQLESVAIQVINAHTSAGGYFAHPESRTIERIRSLQLQQINQFVLYRKTLYQTQLEMIAGDLNCGPHSSQVLFDYLCRLGWLDPWSDEPQDNFYTWDATNPLNVKSLHKHCPSQRIDHILLSEDKKNLVYQIQARDLIFEEPIVESKWGPVTLSDHYGVRVEVEVEE